MKKKTNRRKTMRTTNRTVKVSVSPELSEAIQTRIITLLDRKNGSWNGTMTDLNAAITSGLRKTAPSFWPGSPSALRRVMNVVAPRLRRAGVRVQFTRDSSHFRTRIVSLQTV
jgi:hypothetical protein